MKKYISKNGIIIQIFSLLIVVSIILVACKKETSIQQIKIADYEEIGVLHNEGLNFVLESFRENKVGNKISLQNLQEIYAIIEESSLSFSKETFGLKDNECKKLELNLEEMDLLIKAISKDEGITNQILSEINLSEQQIYYFNKIENIMSDVTLNLEQTLDNIGAIEIEIITQCPEEDIDVLLSSTSVGKHSLVYWNENFDFWIDELIGSTGNKSEEDWEWFWGTLKNMGKSDLVGAGIGAGVGAIAGGVGAAPGAVAGACYSSAGRGIVALLDHWEVW